MNDGTLSSLYVYGRRALEGSPDFCGDASVDAMALLAAASGMDRGRLLAEMRSAPGDGVAERYRSFVRRRADGEPFAYITGEREFMSLPFYVERGCLVPRPETELLVEHALGLGLSGDSRVLDMCSGGGCIAVSVAFHAPGCLVAASDVSGRAVALAKRNAERNGVSDRIEFFCGDLFDPLPAGRKFDVILSNPPYIGVGEEVQDSVRKYEPFEALFSDDDGMALTGRIVGEAPLWLSPGGVLAVEINSSRGAAVSELFRASGFSDVSVKRDYSGLDRIVSGFYK